MRLFPFIQVSITTEMPDCVTIAEIRCKLYKQVRFSLERYLTIRRNSLVYWATRLQMEDI